MEKMKFCLLVFVALGVLWFICLKLKDMYGKQVKRFIRRKNLKRRSYGIINAAVLFYDREGVIEALRNFANLSFNSVRDDYDRIFSQTILSDPCKYQEFFDQLLKTYADKLHEAYAAEEKFRKKYRDRDIPNSFSRKEIEAIMYEERMVIKNKEAMEKCFWELHDTLKELGLRTWGDRSYKLYVGLKPLRAIEAMRNKD